MHRELRAFYEQLETNVQQEIELSRLKIGEAETELRQLTELHNQKHAVSRSPFVIPAADLSRYSIKVTGSFQCLIKSFRRLL